MNNCYIDTVASAGDDYEFGCIVVEDAVMTVIGPGAPGMGPADEREVVDDSREPRAEMLARVEEVRV